MQPWPDSQPPPSEKLLGTLVIPEEEYHKARLEGLANMRTWTEVRDLQGTVRLCRVVTFELGR